MTILDIRDDEYNTVDINPSTYEARITLNPDGEIWRTILAHINDGTVTNLLLRWAAPPLGGAIVTGRITSWMTIAADNMTFVGGAALYYEGEYLGTAPFIATID